MLGFVDLYMFSSIKKAIKTVVNGGAKSFSSREYWNRRYLKGGNSGAGSYGRLASFKAEIINEFVERHQVRDVIEFGCGDGNQLRYMRYPHYIGFDVSRKAIDDCKAIYKDDYGKKFLLMHEYNNEQAELTLSLEVIFHLVEDGIFHGYMERLFLSSNRYVIIYSSDHTGESNSQHVRHRAFSQWILDNKVPFRLINKIKNRYPYDGTEDTSFSDFYFFERIDA